MPSGAKAAVAFTCSWATAPAGVYLTPSTVSVRSVMSLLATPLGCSGGFFDDGLFVALNDVELSQRQVVVCRGIRPGRPPLDG